ncbi:MAG: hypothetical protein AAGB14_08410 [Verrucomicrobiota bacterium]
MTKRPLNSRFTDKVLDEIKITTIRDNPWPIGRPIMLYNWSGAPYRSKHVDVAVIVVLDCWPISIERTDSGMRYEPCRLGGRALWQCEGFDSQEDMDAWFSAKMKAGEAVTKHLMRFELKKGGQQ